MAHELATQLVEALAARGLTIAVAESLTGGLLVAELVAVPGASAVVRGGVVAYDTALKASVLGVDDALLKSNGPVDPTVARQMARGVRRLLSVDGMPAAIGVSTTGVAGPDAQGGKPVGTVFVGTSSDAGEDSVELTLSGDREGIRNAVVSESLSQLIKLLETRH